SPLSSFFSRVTDTPSPPSFQASRVLLAQPPSLAPALGPARPRSNRPRISRSSLTSPRSRVGPSPGRRCPSPRKEGPKDLAPIPLAPFYPFPVARLPPPASFFACPGAKTPPRLGPAEPKRLTGRPAVTDRLSCLTRAPWC
ncbi:hypothetical protein DMC30DRAFT_420774, partial [Rhodotorula diobovata]